MVVVVVVVVGCWFFVKGQVGELSQVDARRGGRWRWSRSSGLFHEFFVVVAVLVVAGRADELIGAELVEVGAYGRAARAHASKALVVVEDVLAYLLIGDAGREHLTALVASGRRLHIALLADQLARLLLDELTSAQRARARVAGQAVRVVILVFVGGDGRGRLYGLVTFGTNVHSLFMYSFVVVFFYENICSLD